MPNSFIQQHPYEYENVCPVVAKVIVEKDMLLGLVLRFQMPLESDNIKRKYGVVFAWNNPAEITVLLRIW